MHALRKAALLSSGGKDTVLALEYARRGHADITVVKLVTCLSQAYDRVSMHGVRRALIEDQAEALGLPVEFVVIPSHDTAPCPMAGTDVPPNDVYSNAMLAALGRLKGEGVEVVVFGDIFLEDLRAYRERLLAATALQGRYPLWGRDTGELFDEFIGLGYKAVTVCVDVRRPV
jgi:diphthamide synthase (EF-2-diphthine--ammonia ligase)